MTQGFFRRILPQILTLAVIIAVIGVIFPGFFSIQMANGRLFGSPVDILNRGAPVALLAIGMTLVIATRGIDLSVGAVMAICGAVAASSVEAGHGTLVAVMAALGAGLLCGLWNGFLVAILKIQPIVATLILMVAGRGIAQLITSGTILTFSDPGLIFVGGGTLFWLPTPVVIWLTAAVIAVLVIRRTALGLLIEAVGVNPRASTLAGINARALTLSVYVVSGLCAALAGVIVASDIRGADANNAGLWLELDAILAVVVGGNSLLGGRFSIVASLLGAMVIQSINTGILISGFPPEFNLVIKACIILVILVLQSPNALALAAAVRTPRVRTTPSAGHATPAREKTTP